MTAPTHHHQGGQSQPSGAERPPAQRGACGLPGAPGSANQHQASLPCKAAAWGGTTGTSEAPTGARGSSTGRAALPGALLPPSGARRPRSADGRLAGAAGLCRGRPPPRYRTGQNSGPVTTDPSSVSPLPGAAACKHGPGPGCSCSPNLPAVGSVAKYGIFGLKTSRHAALVDTHTQRSHSASPGAVELPESKKKPKMLTSLKSLYGLKMQLLAVAVSLISNFIPSFSLIFNLVKLWFKEP